MHSLFSRAGRCALVLFAAAYAAVALDPTSLKPEGYVSDYAHVIDGASRAQLERYAARLDQASGVQLAFVTIDTLDGDPVEDFANRLYHTWGIGKKGTDEGALVLLVVKDRRSRIEIGKGLEPIVTDGRAGSILRDMRPALQANDFGDAMLLAAQRLGERIQQEKGITFNEERPRARRAPQGTSIPWPVLLGGAVLLFWILGGASRGGRGGGGGGLLTGMLLGNLLGRGMSWGGGRYGGGGFGGYDSGDSFGGFGGGDSGGGGASSGW